MGFVWNLKNSFTVVIARISSLYFMKIISKIVLKYFFAVEIRLLCSSITKVSSGPKSHTFTAMLAMFSTQPRWRHKSCKGLLGKGLLSTAQEHHLNQFVTADVIMQKCKVKFSRGCGIIQYWSTRWFKQRLACSRPSACGVHRCSQVLFSCTKPNAYIMVIMITHGTPSESDVAPVLFWIPYSQIVQLARSHFGKSENHYSYSLQLFPVTYSLLIMHAECQIEFDTS